MTHPGSPHRAWIVVDHDAIRGNLRVVREAIGGASVIAVVKANAYGHGAVAVSRTLVDAGVEHLAVATIDEAEQLRAADIDAPLLLLWGFGQGEAPGIVKLGLEPVVYDARMLGWLEEAASSAKSRARVHLKLDTGLGRQGADPGVAVDLAHAVTRSAHLELAGTMTHLAVPGEDDAYTEVQLLRLARTLDAMRSSGINPGLVHASASAGILSGAIGPADAVRPGLALYGMRPTRMLAASIGARLLPALALKARALRIFELPAGEGIGYGLRHRAASATRIAILGIGYGDGWPRAHASNGWALVRGRRAPIVGAVSMDGLAVDVGQIAGVTYDDEFVLIGEQSGERITVDEVAEERRTINYEVTTALRGRLPRLHLGAD